MISVPPDTKCGRRFEKSSEGEKKKKTSKPPHFFIALVNANVPLKLSEK